MCCTTCAAKQHAVLMLSPAHLQPKEQPPNLDHSEWKPLMLPDLGVTQGEDHYKVAKGNSNDHIDTDLGADIECTRFRDHGGMAEGPDVLEHLLGHCKRQHSCEKPAG